MRCIKLCLLLLLALGLMLISFLLTVNPNDYKTNLAQQLEQQLHRPVTIKGDMKWHMWPILSVQISDIEIGENNYYVEQKTPFASIDAMHASFAIFPLFKKQLQVDELDLENVVINLQNKKHGSVNWADLLDNTSISSITNTLQRFTLNLNKITMSNIVIHWDNPVRNDNLTLVIDHLTTGFKTGQLNPLQVNGKLMQASQSRYWQFDIKGNYEGITDITGKFNLQMGDTKNSQSIAVQLNKQPKSSNNDEIIINDVTLDRLYLSQIDMNFLAMFLDLLPKPLVINHFFIGEFSMPTLQLQAITTAVKVVDKTLTLPFLDATVYSGKLKGNAEINFNTPLPNANVNIKLKDANLYALLSAMTADNEITGTIAMDLQLNTQGMNETQMKQQAIGSGTIDITHCLYHGSHYLAEIDKTLASVNNFQDGLAVAGDALAVTEANITQNTSSNQVSGTIQIHQGIVDELHLLVNEKTLINRYGPLDAPHLLIDVCRPF